MLNSAKEIIRQNPRIFGLSLGGVAVVVLLCWLGLSAALMREPLWTMSGPKIVLLLGLILVAIAAIAAAVASLARPALLALAEQQERLNRAPDPNEFAHARAQLAEANKQLDTALDDNIKWRAKIQLSECASDALGARLLALVRSTEERVIVTDAETKIIALSAGAATVMAVRSNEAIGQPCDQVLRLFNAHKQTPEEYPLKTFVRDVIERASAMLNLQEVVLSDSRNTARRIMLSSEAVLDPQGTAIGALIRIFPEGHEQDGERSEVMAAAAGIQRDPTTKLPTHADFDHRLSELINIAQQQQESHQLLLLAVDNLQDIYDAHGFWAGEELLWQISQLVFAELSTAAELFRVTAVHFALLLPFENASKAEQIAERIRMAVEAERCSWKDKQYAATVSIAVSCVDKEASGTSAVLAQADESLRQARKAGGNRVRRHQSDELLLETQAIEKQLMQWLKSDTENSRLQLQSRELVSARVGEKPLIEAMLRVEMDDGFWIDPAAFLSSAQNFGLSHSIDTWMLRNSLATMVDSPSLGDSHELLLVPIAGDSLLSENFVAELEAIVENSLVKPERLVLVVDELSARNRPSKVAAFRKKLTELGVGFGLRQCRIGALDDLVLRFKPQLVGLHGSLASRATTAAVEHQIACFKALGADQGYRTYASDIADGDKRSHLQRAGVDFVGDQGGPLGPLSVFVGLSAS